MNREVEHALERTHTVRSLIEALEGFDPDARVLLVSDYGDYHHTQQALPIDEIIDCSSNVLHESAYSYSSVAVSSDDPEDVEDDDEPIILLRA